MSQYNKLFGSIFGGIAGLLAELGLSSIMLTPENLDALAILAGSAFGTWVAKRNADPRVVEKAPG